MAPRQWLIGVATTVKPKDKTVKGRHYTRPAVHYCRMAESAAALGARLVIFDPDAIDWSSGHVFGWRPVNRTFPYRDWERCKEGLPDVIYDNVFVHLAVAGKCRNMRSAAKARGIPLFNPPLPSKWQAIRFMKSAGLGQYVPETFLLTDVNKAIRAIDDWKVTYVKPVGGYGGSGVMRIEATGKQTYRVSVDRTARGTKKQRSFVRREELARILRGRRGIAHLVQRGIPLLKIDGRSVDFRVVTARGVTGDWQVIGIVPKIAAADGVVTNVIAGGERMSLEQFESLASRHDITVPTRELSECAIACSDKLSGRSQNAGLLGYDLGVDNRGRVWVIEVNPKPARSLLSDDMKREMARLTTGFALYLARRRSRGALRLSPQRANLKITAAALG